MEVNRPSHSSYQQSSIPVPVPVPVSGASGTAGQGQGAGQGMMESVCVLLNSTSCFDLMRNSSKIVFFETTIQYQHAFFALLENECEIAPLWDLQQRSFLAMVGVGDFLKSLCQLQRGVQNSIVNLPLADVLQLDNSPISCPEFESLDAEDNVYQLCVHLRRNNVNYTPIVDPEEGNIVAILGYADILHMLVQAANQFPAIFAVTVDKIPLERRQVVSASCTASMAQVIALMIDHNVESVPVVDSTGKVVGIYNDNDALFLAKLGGDNLDQVNLTLADYIVQDIINLQQCDGQQGQYRGSCKPNDTVKSVIDQMTILKTTRLAYLDSYGSCCGVIGVKDIIWYYYGQCGLAK